MKATRTARWTGNDKRLCVLVEMESYRKSEDEAKQFCDARTFPSPFAPTGEQLKEIESEFVAVQ